MTRRCGQCGRKLPADANALRRFCDNACKNLAYRTRSPVPKSADSHVRPRTLQSPHALPVRRLDDIELAARLRRSEGLYLAGLL